MQELLDYFDTAVLPVVPVRINLFMTITDASVFVESCLQRIAKGDLDCVGHLGQLRAYIEANPVLAVTSPD